MSELGAALPVVALVGRPNVGKSTLFNRLTRSRDALVADQPGVTRDRHYGYAVHAGQRYIVVDTGGIGQDDEDIDARALAQTNAALEEADVVLLVVDYRQGIMSGDEAIAAQLRRQGARVIITVNKSEGQTTVGASAEFHALGLGDPWAISAEHGDRVNLLLDDVFADLPSPRAAVRAHRSDAVRLAVLGRPNAGKSTLVNRLIGDDRMLTQDAPGTTRDAVASEFTFDDKPYVIVDTAGVRRRARIDDALEKISVIKAMQAAEQAQVVLLVIDGAAGLSTQDIRLLNLVVERGRAAVIAVNKWDGLDARYRERLHADLVERMGVFDFLPLVFISALHGSGLRNLLDAVQASHRALFAELSTPQLSRALEAAVEAHAPPAIHGRRIKLRFAHQGGQNPPKIVVHGNQTQRLSAEYKRYLVRRFREHFDLFGTPIHLVFKNSENPYADKAKARPRPRRR
ncbi:ribosome biogenesis GTPase Der [Salinisphaera sp. Q1T1-3]|uniref:ribosome biogenesis GTPase Der n=1 Tax=Salinisphaera sp. Q1T1-3 TaxID=2321229 RepID=UPI000E70FFDD|nr:ribosome biogenesis GTPase Der [Salinisphaera sp. Q1T1-3]RJS92321.1 ribosome biogenesis GTPase Der [Salinisphaera sp. Q1T1-3]